VTQTLTHFAQIANCRRTKYKLNFETSSRPTEDNPIHEVTMTLFAISLYGQGCGRHVAGQQVVSDVSVVRSCC